MILISFLEDYYYKNSSFGNYIYKLYNVCDISSKIIYLYFFMFYYIIHIHYFINNKF